jgi:hypothetical protein
MSQSSSRVAALARAPFRVWFALSATALLSLVLLLAPHPSRAAATVKTADVLGRWITDKAQPDMDYNVTAAPAGKIIVEVPAKAVGRPKGETVTLDPVGPGAFATPKDQPVHASFTVKGARQAEFKMMINRPNAFNVTDQLLERP